MLYHIEIWGCQMNEHDAEILGGLIEREGYVRTDDPSRADLICLYTCCVREKAEAKVLGRIGQLRREKKERPGLILAVGGCMTQQKQVARYISTHFKGVDIIFGTHNLHRFGEMLSQVRQDNRALLEVWDNEGAEIAENLPAARSGTIKGYVNIIYGCNNFCSYCIVPYVRGRERSREPDEIEAEVRDLLDKGYQEIMLLGQNVNSYGRGLSREITFGGLLRRLDRLGTYRLRYMTSHPRDFNEELLEAIRESPNVCRQFHLPLQSGSTRILKEMRRGYTQESYLALIRRIYELFPEASLSTDIIVGFPGETEEDFEATLEVVEKARFDQAFTFLYSPREGTPAAEMEDQVPEEVKADRFARLLDLQNRISLSKNQAMTGQVYEVLVEGPSRSNGSVMAGRTEGNKVVNFPGPEELTGQLVPVEITEAKTWSLYGRIRGGKA